MLILFDHGTPRSIARWLQGHTVVEAVERGWDKLNNGALLNMAEEPPPLAVMPKWTFPTNSGFSKRVLCAQGFPLALWYAEAVTPLGRAVSHVWKTHNGYPLFHPYGRSIGAYRGVEALKPAGHYSCFAKGRL